jgi:sigma-B regulation protein RsbU (phosphoserine phosphatase)
VKVPLGALLCFYTDGLVERREFPIDEGLARLCQAVTAEPPDAACASVMGALVGAEPAPDDIALLVFRREPLSARAGAEKAAPMAETAAGN